MKRISAIILVLFFGLGVVSSSAQGLTLAPYITDSMVVQRDTPIIIKGTASAGQQVKVVFGGKSASAISDVSGNWKVVLPSMKGSDEDRDMEIVCAREKVVVKCVLVGDVWFAGGQSNMAFKVQGMEKDERLAMAREANYSKIRCYYRANVVSGGKLIDKPDRKWSAAIGRNIYDWSAIAYLFAVEIYNKYGIPIGIVNCTHGGSTAEAWISPEAFSQSEELTVAIGKKYEGIQTHYCTPSSLFTAMLEVFEGLPLKGVLWYQGESNGYFAEKYQTMFTGVINDWRRHFDSPQLPFIFAQLPSYRVPGDLTNEKWANLRWAQYQVWKNDPNTAMVVTSEYGDPENIHPKNKRPVAMRFVSAARSTVYGDNVAWKIALPETAKYDNGNIIVEFTCAKGSVGIRGNDPQIEVCGEDGVYYAGKCKIKSSVLIVACPEVAKPVKVRYAWSNINRLSLYDKAGVPVPPFELVVKY